MSAASRRRRRLLRAAEEALWAWQSCQTRVEELEGSLKAAIIVRDDYKREIDDLLAHVKDRTEIVRTDGKLRYIERCDFPPGFRILEIIPAEPPE